MKEIMRTLHGKTISSQEVKKSSRKRTINRET